MTEIKCNEQVCSGCGLCIEVCPYNRVEFEGGKAQFKIENCFLCGHCRSVCSEGAITIPSLPEQLSYQTIIKKPSARNIDIADLVTLMETRRSCRSYSSKSVPIEILQDLIKIGTTAPSGTNCQGWNFTIVPTRIDMECFGAMVANYYRNLNKMASKILVRLITKFFHGDSLGRYYRKYYRSISDAIKLWDDQRVDQLFHGAPAAIVVSANTKSSCPSEDCLLATQNIAIAAHTMGLGSCLIGFAVHAARREKKIKEYLLIPGIEEIYSVIVIGHPAVEYLQFSGRFGVVPRIVGQS